MRVRDIAYYKWVYIGSHSAISRTENIDKRVRPQIEEDMFHVQ